MVYRFYNFFLTLFFILGLPFVPFLFLFGPRFREGFWQRIGFYPREARERLRGSRPIWIHAASVGEVLSAGRLVAALKERFPERKILLSTSTSTGNRIARQTVNGGDAAIFLPFDHPWIVGRALALFDPSLFLFLEKELWPSLLHAAYRRGIPTFLISGRLSPRSFRRYFFWRLFFSGVVRQLTAVGMQSEKDARRMIRLGVDPRKVSITGNLKHAALESDGANGQAIEAISVVPKMEENRQVLVVGSTHRGEEEILLDVFLLLKSSFPALLMVLAPRHPHRFSEVERLLQKRGVRYEKKSLMNGGGGNLPDVIFLDTIGELPAFYSLADVAFVGGSLVNAGGHNLLEPARWRKPILFGPHMTNFADIAAEMKRAGGGIEVRERDDLFRALSGLLTDHAKAERMGEMAYLVVEGDRGVVDRSIGLVSRYL